LNSLVATKMRWLSGISASLALLLSTVYGQVSWTVSPFNPPSIPLAVRTPYLSAWLPQGSGAALNSAWPTFWTGSVRVKSRLFFFRYSPCFRFSAGQVSLMSTAPLSYSWGTLPFRMHRSKGPPKPVLPSVFSRFHFKYL